jgi:hypothetical protein
LHVSHSDHVAVVRVVLIEVSGDEAADMHREAWLRGRQPLSCA